MLGIISKYQVRGQRNNIKVAGRFTGVEAEAFIKSSASNCRRVRLSRASASPQLLALVLPFDRKAPAILADSAVAS